MGASYPSFIELALLQSDLTLAILVEAEAIQGALDMLQRLINPNERGRGTPQIWRPDADASIRGGQSGRFWPSLTATIISFQLQNHFRICLGSGRSERCFRKSDSGLASGSRLSASASASNPRTNMHAKSLWPTFLEEIDDELG
ncbi:hypothetical protein DICSQDRAFT_133277, partial [Dichomitus squalens LYAD-421 SS1]|uniref:uncharacterized protein n=1 Tax=Dichomitus squalens (strain LYAD-421) TaxID=732165 RepID=UPI0004413B63